MTATDERARIEAAIRDVFNIHTILLASRNVDFVLNLFDAHGLELRVMEWAAEDKGLL